VKMPLDAVLQTEESRFGVFRQGQSPQLRKLFQPWGSRAGESSPFNQYREDKNSSSGCLGNLRRDWFEILVSGSLPTRPNNKHENTAFSPRLVSLLSRIIAILDANDFLPSKRGLQMVLDKCQTYPGVTWERTNDDCWSRHWIGPSPKIQRTSLGNNFRWDDFTDT